MNYEIVATDLFARELKRLAKKYPGIKQDIALLSAKLEHDPIMGILISEDCYKIRFAITGKARGKSGGGRMITLVKVEQEKVVLLAVYDKSEFVDISDEELKARLKSA